MNQDFTEQSYKRTVLRLFQDIHTLQKWELLSLCHFLSCFLFFSTFKINSHEVHQRLLAPVRDHFRPSKGCKRMCLSQGSTTVMNTMTKSKVQRKGLIGLVISPLKSGQKLKQESGADTEVPEGCCSQVCSPWLSQPASYSTQPRAASPTMDRPSHNNLKNVLKACLPIKSELWGLFSQLRLPTLRWL